MNIRIVRYKLNFIRPAKTSRDVLHTRDVFYLLIQDESAMYTGIGECSPIWGLSPEKQEDLELFLDKLNLLSANPAALFADLKRFPSVRFALETAMRDLAFGGKRIIFPSTDKPKIGINGLVWMNSKQEMITEARHKVLSGYSVLKFKIGGLDFEDELAMLHHIRSEFSTQNLVIRLDANGAFLPSEAMDKLKALSAFTIHSIEQPIRAGQWELMGELTSNSPIPIALDEELISVEDNHEKQQLLDTIKPQFLVLKPTLHGGFSGCDEWIDLAQKRGIQWWATSALESNIGLNAIAQWVASKNNSLAQGLGTGALYANNIDSPLEVENGFFFWNKKKRWNVKSIIGNE